METVTATGADAPNRRRFDLTNPIIASVIFGIIVGQFVFYLALGLAPAIAMGRPMWAALALGGFGLGIAVKERGFARFAFLAWAFHQALIALTFVGDSGWVPWTIRSSILALAASLLVASAWPVSVRDKRAGILVFFLAAAFTVGTKWAGWAMLR
jgi:hypothetical protein